MWRVFVAMTVSVCVASAQESATLPSSQPTSGPTSAPLELAMPMLVPPKLLTESATSQPSEELMEQLATKQLRRKARVIAWSSVAGIALSVVWAAETNSLAFAASVGVPSLVGLHAAATMIPIARYRKLHKRRPLLLGALSMGALSLADGVLFLVSAVDSPNQEEEEGTNSPGEGLIMGTAFMGFAYSAIAMSGLLIGAISDKRQEKIKRREQIRSY